MIEEPKLLTIKKNWERPSKKQLKAFENIPTGFVTDALNGKEYYQLIFNLLVMEEIQIVFLLS